MVITTDLGAGFQLTPGAEPLDDVPPGGEYAVECSPQHAVVLQSVTVRDFALGRLCVGKLCANVVDAVHPGTTGAAEDRRYRLDPPVPVAVGETIRAVLKNAGGVPKKPKVAVLIRGGQEVAR